MSAVEWVITVAVVALIAAASLALVVVWVREIVSLLREIKDDLNEQERGQ